MKTVTFGLSLISLFSAVSPVLTEAWAKDLTLKDLSPAPLSEQRSRPDIANFRPPQAPDAAGKTVICKLPLGKSQNSILSGSQTMSFVVSDQDGYQQCSEKGGEIAIATKESERNGMDIKNAAAPRKASGK